MSSADQLVSATKGFDHLFANEIEDARTTFAADDSPFHLLGLGVCSFLEAALGMEVRIGYVHWRNTTKSLQSGLMVEATRCLTLAEAGAKKRAKASSASTNSRFTPGLEWEVLHSDTVVLLGMTNALRCVILPVTT